MPYTPTRAAKGITGIKGVLARRGATEDHQTLTSTTPSGTPASVVMVGICRDQED